MHERTICTCRVIPACIVSISRFAVHAITSLGLLALKRPGLQSTWGPCVVHPQSHTVSSSCRVYSRAVVDPLIFQHFQDTELFLQVICHRTDWEILRSFVMILTKLPLFGRGKICKFQKSVA